MIRSNNERFPRRLAIVSLLAAILALFPSMGLSGQEADTRKIGAGETDLRTTLDFADWLRSGGDDANAEREYLRYLFRAEDDASPAAQEHPDRAVLALADIYRSRKDYEKLLRLAERYGSSVADGDAAKKLAFLRGLAIVNGAKPDESGAFTANRDWNGDDGSTALALADRLYRDDITGAQRVLNDANPEFARDSLVRSIRADIETFKPKNEFLAIGLSAIVPGLGKAYARQTADAVFSFVTTGALSALTAYTAINEGPGSWKTWMYGASAGLMYGANLYGSRQAALRYNETGMKDIRTKMEDILDEYPR